MILREYVLFSKLTGKTTDGLNIHKIIIVIYERFLNIYFSYVV